MAWLLPVRWLERALGHRRKTGLDDLATVIFSSGSTGEPKGVMLSHYNIGSNIEQLEQVFGLDKRDRILGILPFFHSFGFTGTLSLPAALGVGMPILALWFASPAIAWWISRPLARRGARLTADQTLFLRKLSRKTWAFFDTFVGPEDRWLPPDNYQDHSAPVVAHRTSPTNMGLALLANLSAYDFGYITAGHLVDRTAKAFHTMGRALS